MKRFILIVALALALCATSVCVAEEAEAPEVDSRIAAFFDTWSCDGHSIEIYQEDDGTISASALASINDTEDFRWNYTNLTFDEASSSLTCEGTGVKTHNVTSDDVDEMKIEEVASELGAAFTLTDEDQLVWDEKAENAGEGLRFDRLDAAEEMMGEARSLRLGSSKYVVLVGDDYQPVDLTEEDIANDQVGYFASENTLMDFDIYQFDKGELNPELSKYVIEEASHFGNVDMVKAIDEINGIPVAWYRAVDSYEDKNYDTLVYILDDGDTYVRVVFWLDGENAEAEVDAIIQSLRTIETKELRLGTTPYFIKVLASYEPGEVSEEDKSEDQVGYFESEESLVDFDVYQISKEGVSQELSQYALDEAAMYERTSEIDTSFEINGINLAWYRTTENYEGEDYETVTYIVDNGDEYLNLVFWLDGANAEAEVNAIIKSLYRAEPRQLTLGQSDYAVVLPDGFRENKLGETDQKVGHLAYWYDAEGNLELDVYQYPKADLEGTLEDYLKEMAEGQEDVVTYNANDTVNGIPVAWCQFKAEFDGQAFNTKTLLLDDGEDYLELTFWMKGGNSEEMMDGIVDSLTRVQPEAEAAEEEPQG